MDYCIPCNRTLNGAVTCPECGAYDSGVAQPSGRRDGAPAVDAVMPEVRFDGVPDSFESSVPGPPTPSPDLPEDRYDRPSRLRKYAVRSLAAAAFTVLGGLATASVLHQSTAPRAASPPEPSFVEPEISVTDSPASPEREPTHPARKGGRDRNGDGNRRPAPPPPRSTPPVSRPSTATTSAPPPVKEKPTPRPSSSRRPSPPARTAPPSTRPSASPSASTSASPTRSGSPSASASPGR